jgi:hypothetical protein
VHWLLAAASTKVHIEEVRVDFWRWQKKARKRHDTQLFKRMRIDAKHKPSLACLPVLKPPALKSRGRL